MPYLIIIRATLGCGKTTISKLIAKELNAEYISIDKVMNENNLDIVSEDEGCISTKNFIKGNEIILPTINKFLENGKSVIVDGCFYHKKQIENLINQTNAKHLVFTLKASVETCIHRDKGRHLSYGECAARAVHSLVSRFDYGIIIDTENKTKKQIKEEILKKIKKKYYSKN